MQASQIETGLRQFRTICTPFQFLFVGGGVRVRLRTLSFRGELTLFNQVARHVYM